MNESWDFKTTINGNEIFHFSLKTLIRDFFLFFYHRILYDNVWTNLTVLSAFCFHMKYMEKFIHKTQYN